MIMLTCYDRQVVKSKDRGATHELRAKFKRDEHRKMCVRGFTFFLRGIGPEDFLEWDKKISWPPKISKKKIGDPPKFRKKISWPPKISEKNFVAPQKSKTSSAHRTSSSMTSFNTHEVQP